MRVAGQDKSWTTDAHEVATALRHVGVSFDACALPARTRVGLPMPTRSLYCAETCRSFLRYALPARTRVGMPMPTRSGLVRSRRAVLGIQLSRSGMVLGLYGCYVEALAGHLEAYVMARVAALRRQAEHDYYWDEAAQAWKLWPYLHGEAAPAWGTGFEFGSEGLVVFRYRGRYL